MKFSLLTLVFSSIYYSCLASDPMTLLLKNGDSYPSWYPRLIGGTAAIAKVKLMDDGTKKENLIQCEIKGNGSVATRSFARVPVHIKSLLYRPAYFHVVDISLVNAFKNGSLIELYERQRSVKSYCWKGVENGLEKIVMIEPCSEIDSAKLQITYVFEESELKSLREAYGRLPQYVENDKGFYLILESAPGTSP